MSTSIYNQESHYVYRITNILENKHYYGSRGCKCDPKDDLGIKYFSSSRDKKFLQEQKEHPEHFKYKIIRTFDNRDEALELEILLHEKFNVGINENFYNLAKQTSIGWSRAGISHSEEHRKNLSEALKGIFRSEETRKKMSAAKKGEKNPLYGKTHSEDTRKKLSAVQKGEKHHQFSGYYHTPFGIFTSSYEQNIIGKNQLRKWCKNNTKVITRLSYCKSQYLHENFDESIIGKTYKELGFSFLINL